MQSDVGAVLSLFSREHTGVRMLLEKSSGELSGASGLFQSSAHARAHKSAFSRYQVAQVMHVHENGSIRGLFSRLHVSAVRLRMRFAPPRDGTHHALTQPVVRPEKDGLAATPRGLASSEGVALPREESHHTRPSANKAARSSSVRDGHEDCHPALPAPGIRVFG